MLTDTASRSGRIDAVLQDCLRRRYAGERLEDHEVISRHPELMPELERSLGKLALVQTAFRKAHGSGSSPSVGNAESPGPPPRLLDGALPGYELLGEIHRGGQGVVYRAIQRSTGQIVAIKVLHAGPFLGSHDRVRFEREVRILGRLRHPNIVAIFDSGVTAGSDWFVMDYVPGPSIDAYAAGENLSIREKLNLFVKVCDAVNAAHLHGVIHRDIKPGNILVDDRGEPRVLDFGLAKIASDDIDDTVQRHAMTLTGQFLGSLPWASPEQAEGAPSGVDMRTDVYSLGVVLYQLLTGRLPYPLAGTVRQVLGRIRESDPIRPRSLDRSITSDLQTIILHCLSKDPSERYSTAGELGDDVRRHLRNEPIHARRPSAGYAVRKFAARHKGASAALGVGLAALLGGSTWISVLYARTKAAHQNTLAAQQIAEHEADQRRAVNEFLVDMLGSPDPMQTRRPEFTLEGALAQAAGPVETRFAAQPEVRAAVHHAIGSAYRGLGLLPQSEHHLRAAERGRHACFGAAHAETVETRSALVDVLLYQRKIEEAHEVAVDNYQACLDAHGELSAHTLKAGYHLAKFFHYDQRFEEANELLERVLAGQRAVLGERHADTLLTHVLWIWNGPWTELRYDETERELRVLLAGCEAVYGPDHPITLDVLIKLGTVVWHLQRPDEAESLLRQVYDTSVATYGADSYFSLRAASDMGQFLFSQGRPADAEAILQRVLDATHPQERGPTVQNAMSCLGLIRLQQNDFSASAEILNETLEMRREHFGNEHPATAETLDALSGALSGMGRTQEALAAAEEAKAIRRLANR